MGLNIFFIRVIIANVMYQGQNSVNTWLLHTKHLLSGLGAIAWSHRSMAYGDVVMQEYRGCPRQRRNDRSKILFIGFGYLNCDITCKKYNGTVLSVHTDFLTRVRQFSNDFHEWHISWINTFYVTLANRRWFSKVAASPVNISGELPHSGTKIVIHGKLSIILYVREQEDPLRVIQ